MQAHYYLDDERTGYIQSYYDSTFFGMGEKKTENKDLEAFSVNNSRTRLIILLFRDPHLLEG